MFDAASRYLLFPLKRAVADALLPHLEMVSPAELCHWLMLADMYGYFLPFQLSLWEEKRISTLIVTFMFQCLFCFTCA